MTRSEQPAPGLPTAIECHSLDHVQLVRFLERRRATPVFPLELSLAENLLEVLRRANGFVPSAAGSILLFAHYGPLTDVDATCDLAIRRVRDWSRVVEEAMQAALMDTVGEA